MGQRNIPFTPMNDLEMNQQGPHHIHPDPCIVYGGNVCNYPQPNMHMILQDNNHGPLPYGMMNHQYNGVIQHHHLAGNLDSPVAAVPNHYNMYVGPPSGTRVFPVPLNHGLHDQFQFSHNHGINEFSVDGYNNHFVDGVFKRKNTGNFQYCYATAGPGPSFPSPRPPLESDLALIDGGSGPVGITESGLPRNPGHIIQGNHLGQPFQMPTAPYLAWNQVPAVPYMHGSINGACLETPNMNLQPGYQVTANNRSPAQFIRPQSIPQGHPNLHHTLPPPPMHAVRGHNIDFRPQVASASSSALPSSRRIPGNSATFANTFQDGTVPAGPRFVGPVPPSGFRIYRPHRRDLMLEAAPRQINLPQLRVLPEDGVAILEFSGYHEGGESTDHHRDLRLDIDHMSYEELLELGEHIGKVGTGLSEESIVKHLKRKTFVLSLSQSNLEQTSCEDPELDFCVICQNEYKDQEKMGVLECEHEYHEECIKKWLIEKNICPICKSPALDTNRKDSS